MAVGFSNTNKPLNPRGQDASPKGYNRASLFSGKALDFDGVNDKVTTTYTSGFTGAQEFTYCAYVYIDSVSGNRAIVHANENTGYGLQSLQLRDGVFRFYAGTGSSDTSLVDSELVEINKWYFVVGTHTATENKIYLNGVLNGTATSASLTIAPDAIVVGAYPSDVLNFNGQISNAKIFNTALTAAQVADLYNNPEKIVPTGLESNLKLWLPMMEGAGTTAYDGSGNGNHGTISGATYVNGIGAPVAQSAVIDWNKGSNLVTYSEDFSQWGTNDSPVVTASSTIAPDGSTNAADVTASGSNAFTRVKSPTISMAGDYVGSFYLKKTTGAVTNYPGFDIGGPGHYVLVDTTNGTAQGTGGSYTDISVTSYNETWWRVSAKINLTTTDNAIRLWPALSDNPSSIQSYVAGTATFWGAQVEQADAIGSYVYTGATAQTSEVLLPQGLTTGRDITGVNLFENVRKQGALNLDGNSWAEVHDNESLDMTTTATMEAWVNADGLDGGYDIIMVKSSSTFWTGNYGRYTLRANEANVNWWFDDFTANSKYYSIALSGWNHLVVAKNGTEEKLYLNGVLVDTETGPATFTASPYSLVIGANSSKVEHWQSAIAQPRIYNRALTASEVLQNYNSGKNTYK